MKKTGFTLLEVLISLIVFSFALLALAALVTKGLQFNTGSLHRFYAATQAYDMADRMRANRKATINGDYDKIISSAKDKPICLCDKDCGCTPTNMAKFDAWQWNIENSKLLPNGSGLVKKTGADTFLIVISWDESRISSEKDRESFEFQFQR
tara:strand:- start:174 stop:629 length:456 start_codon:yes stop_codon:yes gene_type:complete